MKETLGNCTLALDLGQASDFSALVILESKPLDTSNPEVKIQRHDCRGLKRWPLGTSYTVIVSEVASMIDRLALLYPPLVVDATGVGRPVVDMLRRENLPVTLEPVMITAGSGEGYHGGFHHVAKMILIANLNVLLQQRRLRFARTMPALPILIRELQNYQVKITPAANEIFDARSGEHDDVLLALALAAWNAERCRPFDVPIVLPNERYDWRNDPNCPFHRRRREGILGLWGRHAR